MPFILKDLASYKFLSELAVQQKIENFLKEMSTDHTSVIVNSTSIITSFIFIQRFWYCLYILILSSNNLFIIPE